MLVSNKKLVCGPIRVIKLKKNVIIVREVQKVGTKMGGRCKLYLVKCTYAYVLTVDTCGFGLYYISKVDCKFGLYREKKSEFYADKVFLSRFVFVTVVAISDRRKKSEIFHSAYAIVSFAGQIENATQKIPNAFINRMLSYGVKKGLARLFWGFPCCSHPKDMPESEWEQ